jgi:hypothetical protein
MFLSVFSRFQPRKKQLSSFFSREHGGLVVATIESSRAAERRPSGVIGWRLQRLPRRWACRSEAEFHAIGFAAPRGIGRGSRRRTMEHRSRWCDPQQFANYGCLTVDDQRVVCFGSRWPNQTNSGSLQGVFAGAATETIYNQFAALQHRGYGNRVWRAFNAICHQISETVTRDHVCQARQFNRNTHDYTLAFTALFATMLRQLVCR